MQPRKVMSPEMKPLISIITATYNAGQELIKTIESIKNQTFKNFEFIVIDGGSTDGTIKIIEDYYPEVIKYYVSERDSGIFDAWNKGLSVAQGQWVAFLGAGDEYYSDALAQYSNSIQDGFSEMEYISSKVEIVDSEGKLLFVRGSKWEWNKFKKFMNTAHVGSLHSKKLFEKYGVYDTSYKIAGDYELLMRALENLNAGFVNETTAKMLYGGTSMTSISFKNYDEDFRIKTEVGKQNVLRSRIENFLSFLRAKIKYFLNRNGIFFHINN